LDLAGFLERDKYRILLASLVAMVYIQPLLSELRFTSWLFFIFVTINLFACVYSVRRQRRHLIIAISMTIPTLILVWLDIPSKDNWYNLLSNTSPILLFSYIAYLIFMDLIRAKRVDADMIAGGISIYFMIGLVFAFIYIALFNYNPGNFDISAQLLNQAVDSDENIFIYFSYVTMTTLGYGDVTPVTTLARVLVQMETLLGQLFLAIFIARLVGMHIAGGKVSGDKGD
jgi:voltage-gated potassium channel